MKAGKVILIVVITLVVLFGILYLIGWGAEQGIKLKEAELAKNNSNSGSTSTLPKSTALPAPPRTHKVLTSADIDELLNS